MKKNANEKIMMLQYRIKRYQAMGNGAMCQTLNGNSKTAVTAGCHVNKHTNYIKLSEELSSILAFFILL